MASSRYPSDWSREAQIALFLPLGDAGEFTHPEALIYVDGTSYATCDRQHAEVLLRPEWHDGKAHKLALHGWTGNGGFLGADNGTKLLMRQCEVVQLDQPTRDFTITARVALGIARSLDENTPARAHLLNALDAAFKALDTREPFGDRFYESVEAAHDALRTGIEAAGAPLDIDVGRHRTRPHRRGLALDAGPDAPQGRAHLPHRAAPDGRSSPITTSRRASRNSTSTSSNDYPELFEAIKARVAEGRWETIGGMWIEADCNLTGPNRWRGSSCWVGTFFQEHFGEVDSSRSSGSRTCSATPGTCRS